MKARPILFQSEMIRAILDGRKTQTRRVIKDEPVLSMAEITDKHCLFRCPYGQPGDLLWVRETYCLDGQLDNIKPSEGDKTEPVYYPANEMIRQPSCRMLAVGKTRPSIHMPRWANRITLEITNIRVERLQDISDDDAQAEGIEQKYTCICPNNGIYATENDVYDDFRNLWQSINGDDSWEQNPWLWVIEFKPQMMNVDDFISN